MKNSIDIKDLIVNEEELKSKIAVEMEKKFVECDDQDSYVILYHGKRMSIDGESVWPSESAAKRYMTKNTVKCGGKWHLKDFFFRLLIPKIKEDAYYYGVIISDNLIKIYQDLGKSFKEQFEIVSLKEYIKRNQ